MNQSPSQVRSRPHRLAVLALVGCALLFGAVFAPSASASPVVAAAQPDAAQPDAGAVTAASGDWCGPGHGTWKSWWIPDHFGSASFTGSCRRHDICYGTGSYTSRLTCDQNLKASMRSNCRAAYGIGVRRTACYGVATTYYGAVRAFARNNYQGHGSRT